MQIPLAYNLRNLAVRKTTTVMTALGIALTVAVLLAVLALMAGLRQAFTSSAHPLNVLVVRRSAQSELSSNLPREQFNEMRVRSGIARGASGEPLASLELVTVVVLETPSNPSGTNINLRGVTPEGVALREGLRITEGRSFRPGHRECVVGKSLPAKYPLARIGQTLKFGRGDYIVVGVMAHGKSAVNSEIWADTNQVAADYNRTAVLSAALLRATDASAANSLINELKADQRLNVDAMPERKYYDDQTSSGLPIQFIGTMVAVIMAVGSCFAAMNTMYAAVSRRAKEIGTLRVLGFSRLGILLSFFLESLLLSALGGVLGVLLILPLSNFNTAVGSMTSFTEVSFSFSITPEIIVTGLLFGLLMGVLGGIFPAAAAARKEILTALREA